MRSLAGQRVAPSSHQQRGTHRRHGHSATPVWRRHRRRVLRVARKRPARLARQGHRSRVGDHAGCGDHRLGDLRFRDGAEVPGSGPRVPSGSCRRSRPTMITGGGTRLDDPSATTAAPRSANPVRWCVVGRIEREPERTRTADLVPIEDGRRCRHGRRVRVRLQADGVAEDDGEPILSGGRSRVVDRHHRRPRDQALTR